MNVLKNLVLAGGAAVLLSSCAAVKSPLVGTIYSDVKAPVAVTGNSNSTKVGKAEAKSILGIVAFGDASIEAAAKEGGITKIHHVDEQSMSILSIYATYTVYVYGE